MTRFDIRKKYLILIAITLLAIGGGGYWYFRNSSDLAGAVSMDIRSVADFTIYMPQKLPDGFSLKKDSIVFKQGVLFVQFVKDDQTIFVSQQERPNPTPPISSIKGFTDFAVKIGHAVTGEQEGVSAVIITTDSSVITVTGGETVSRSDVGLLAKRFKAID